MNDSVLAKLTTDHSKATRVDVVAGHDSGQESGSPLGTAYNGKVGSWTGRPLAASLGMRGRKVRTPESSVPDNVREVGVKAN